MSPWLIAAGLALSALASLMFSTVSYALRDLWSSVRGHPAQEI